MDFVDINYKINSQENYSFFDDNADISLMNLNEYLVNNNLILYKDSTAFVFTEPFIVDNQGKNYPAKLTIKNKDGLYFGIRMNSKDLRSASYPIYVDPTVKLIGAGANITFDGFVQFSAIYTRDGTSTFVDLGANAEDPPTTSRAIYEWNISLIPDGADVIDINFSFNVAQLGAAPNNRLSFRSMADNSTTYLNNNTGNGLFYNDMGNGTNFTSLDLTGKDFKSVNLSRNESGSKDMELNLDAEKNWWGIGIHTPETAGALTTRLSTSEEVAASRPILTVLYDFILPNITLNNPFNNTDYLNVSGNITLNSTVVDNENIIRLIKYYGSNQTTPTGEFLLYEVRNHSNGTSTQYNWVAPVLTDERSAVLILHFNNQSEFGEFNSSFVRDFSSQGNNGTASGAYFNHSVGMLGGTFKFPGSGSNNINFGDQDELIGNDMSYVAWVNVTGTTSVGGIISKITGTTGLEIRRNKVGGLASVEIFADSAAPLMIHNDFFPANQYTHLGVTIDSGGTIRLYKNGNIVNTTTSSGVTDNNVDFLLGSDGTDLLSGTIDEVGVYNRTLTNKEIRNLYRLPKGKYYWYVNASDRLNTSQSNINTFNIINQAPSITRIDINSTDARRNDTTQNITATRFNATDINDGDDMINITDWRVNGTSIAVLNAPFDLRIFSGNNIRDYSIYNINGSMSTSASFGPPNWSNNCVRGGCYQFNGSQRIDFNHSDIYNFFNENYTIMFWFRLNETDTTLAAQPRLVSKMNGVGNNGWAVFYNNDTKKIGVGVGYIDSFVDTQEPTDPMLINRWYHIAWVWERRPTAAVSGVYINGTLSSTKTFTIAPTDNTLNVTIGMASASVGSQFRGMIDELMIFNRTFNSTQIAMWYKNRTDVLTNDSLMGNQFWHACVTPTDTESDGNVVCSINETVNIQNLVPSVTTTLFEPVTRAANTFTNDTLNCTFTIVDNSTGGLSANITFYNWTLAFGPRFAEPTYNISITNGTSASQLFTAQAQQKNETWWCGIVPFDGLDFGNPVNSSNITIINSPPYVPLLFQPLEGNSSSNIRTSFTWSVSRDEDMDAINYTLLIDCFNITSGGNCPTNPLNDFNQTFVGNSSTNQSLSFDLIYRSDDNLIYNWTVNASDRTNTSEFRFAKRNFSINSLVDLTFETLPDTGLGGCERGVSLNGVAFGTKSPDTTDDTTDDSPNAFGITNTGNVVVDVNVTGTQLFTGTNPGYEFRTNNYSAGSTDCFSESFDAKFSAFNVSKTPTAFIRLNTTTTRAIGSFNYTGGSDGADGSISLTSKGDTVEADINISIPSDELGSTKSSTVNFTGYYRGIASVNMP